jgi:hypothetical protein
VSAEVAATPGGLLGGFIDLCVENVDHLMLPSKRKVIAVGLANLIPTNNEEILKRVGGILNVVVEVLHQERKDDVLCGVGAGDGGPGILGGGFREVLAKQVGVDDDESSICLHNRAHNLHEMTRVGVDDAGPPSICTCEKKTFAGIAGSCRRRRFGGAEPYTLHPTPYTLN